MHMRRLVAPADYDRVYDIYMHETVVPFLGFDPMPREAFSKVFDPLFESGCFYLYEVDGEVMGFYKAQRHVGRTAHVAYLGTLAVAPEAQGRGVAIAMMQDAISRLWQAGITRIELTVEADNPRAIALYERLGFVHEGTQRAAYKRASDSGYVDELMYGLLRND
ncbi:MAG: GNAT family N-acetyltransferase [Gammaproteobacteria bacterium]|jgi:putative acetyltransferase|nr:GNAT family N-acetyltransferase [Stutzerimonas xanthomarina]MBU0810063.1 GNAT family N-acetyltransferase [Gammaproteobacteria bacterium]HAW25000.1 GNAT family N-acetyltransferase [Pseudomonas sp.]MBU0853806.1 GNAT family N-acetyltransferase [Gammaproteobacteria bacterium]MBU1302218.1 GNAT family N-acetyltransferase [Gammaproteobacteria bacterium]|tara:strand:- start:944 stop:1435 length:492 start_codon:yes stop_codon:yes gene_type:complete